LESRSGILNCFDAVGGHSPALSVNRATVEMIHGSAKSAPIDKLRIFLDAGDQD